LGGREPFEFLLQCRGREAICKGRAQFCRPVITLEQAWPGGITTIGRNAATSMKRNSAPWRSSQRTRVWRAGVAVDPAREIGRSIAQIARPSGLPACPPRLSSAITVFAAAGSTCPQAKPISPARNLSTSAGRGDGAALQHLDPCRSRGVVGAGAPARGARFHLGSFGHAAQDLIHGSLAGRLKTRALGFEEWVKACFARALSQG